MDKSRRQHQCNLFESPAHSDAKHLPLGDWAVFSKDRAYRYALGRIWSAAPPMLICGVNPSKADETKNDHTVTRGRYFAMREHCGGVVFVNLFALVETDPKVMRKHLEPLEHPEEVGRADAELVRVCTGAKMLVAAWGVNGTYLNRDQAVLRILRGICPVLCFGVTQHGHPRHPSRLPNVAPLVPFDGLRRS